MNRKSIRDYPKNCVNDHNTVEIPMIDKFKDNFDKIKSKYENKYGIDNNIKQIYAINRIV